MTTLSSFEYLSTQIESQRITVNNLPESKIILHNGIVRVFVRIMHGFTQKTVEVSLMYSSN